MKVLFVGDIVGSPGREIFADLVSGMKKKKEIDFVVANAENVAGGKGITLQTAEELLKSGADVLTLGDHTWDRKEAENLLENSSKIIRPLNFTPGCPGRGYVTVESAFGEITVVNLVGRVFMNAYDCPFRAMDTLLSENSNLGKIILVDIHAEATSEKIAMGRYLDGRVSAVVGTHTHVQTSDETVLSGGTAYLTDLGMTGPSDSVIGRDLESVITIFLTGMPERYKIGQGRVVMEGAIVDISEETGKAKSVKRIRLE
ncbi:TIGR00282 family metallophosphoesterase [Verrucomicrobiota bacterium]